MIGWSSRPFRFVPGHQMRSITVALLVMTVSACGARPTNEVLRPTSAIVEDAQITQVYVATTRAPRTAGSTDFGYVPSLGTSYAAFSVSTPPGHQTGRIEWPGDQIDPATSFATVDSTIMREDEFRTACPMTRARDQVLSSLFTASITTSPRHSIDWCSFPSIPGLMECRCCFRGRLRDPLLLIWLTKMRWLSRVTGWRERCPRWSTTPRAPQYRSLRIRWGGY